MPSLDNSVLSGQNNMKKHVGKVSNIDKFEYKKYTLPIILLINGYHKIRPMGREDIPLILPFFHKLLLKEGYT